MNKKYLAIIVGIILLLVVVAAFVFGSKDKPAEEVTNGNGTFPEGTNVPTEGTSSFGLPTDSGDYEALPKTPDAKARFHKITDVPVAGYLVLGSSDDLNLHLLYTEKETGHIFDYKYQTAIANRLTNTTIPRVQNVLWTSTGERAVFRYFDGDENSIKTYSARLVTEVATDTQETRLEGLFLENNIDEVTLISPQTKSSIFYLKKDESGGEIGYKADIATGKTSAIFKSSFNEWATLWQGKLYLYPKPSGLLEGFLYILNENGAGLSDTSLEKVVGNKLGLAPLPNKTGSKILFSETKESVPAVSLYVAKTKIISALPIKTFAEKCVWSEKESQIFYCAVPLSFPGAVYPDDWYKGKVRLSDALISYNTETGFFQILAVMERDLGEFVDVEGMSLAKDDSIIFFKNKTDQTLWSFSLSKQ
ncbi:MAG TPA: hypothetical protein VJJ24_03270 [Candidatus Paceibacterota bacterium]